MAKIDTVRPTRPQVDSIARRLLEWYDLEKRILPWRRDRTPYSTLVSEFMLQQTQVQTVIPYYERFMQDLPTIEALAQAPEPQVLKLWAGLGYYSRARNLHATAKRIVAEYGGKIPSRFSDLIFLPGIGRYMAGAVASIAYGAQVAAVDANIARVVCRLFIISDNPKMLKVASKLEELAAQLVPRERPGDFNEAMMDLGAGICTAREPRCADCPLRLLCKAHRAGKPEEYPQLPERPQTIEVEEACAVVRNGERYLVWQCSHTEGRYRGMWEFPTVVVTEGKTPGSLLTEEIKDRIGLKVEVEEEWAEIRHQVTHHKIRKRIFLCALSGKNAGKEEGMVCVKEYEDEGVAWATLEEMADLPMGAPHKRILTLLLESSEFFGK